MRAAPMLEVCWSGVLERQGKAPGLTHACIPSTAAIAMRQSFKCGDLTIKWPKPKPKFCAKCGKQEKRHRHNGKGEFGPFGKTCRNCRAPIQAKKGTHQ